ncbi:TetR/AcrR family transcriptional regulator, partial [Amycolatopsis rhizosphaerae]
LNGPSRPLSEVLVLCLTAMATEAGREVAIAPTRVRARRMIAEVLELMGRLYPAAETGV